jgi:hypothetical protein
MLLLGRLPDMHGWLHQKMVLPPQGWHSLKGRLCLDIFDRFAVVVGVFSLSSIAGCDG